MKSIAERLIYNSAPAVFQPHVYTALEISTRRMPGITFCHFITLYTPIAFLYSRKNLASSMAHSV